MADYSVDFWTYSDDTKWNEEALWGIFVKGLNEQMKDELATCDAYADLSSLFFFTPRTMARQKELTRTWSQPWSSHLAWIEYAHNSLSSAATGVSFFEASLPLEHLGGKKEDVDVSLPGV